MPDFTTDPHFKDLINKDHLHDHLERLPGPNGEQGAGMRIQEALPLAELWWETKGRFSMPDYGKDPHEQITPSGVMMGLPWFNLDKQEILRIIAHWYVHVGIPTILGAQSTSDDGDTKNSKDLREEGKGVFEVLDTACTHTPTKGDTEENIDQAETLVDAQGEKLKPKGSTE